MSSIVPGPQKKIEEEIAAALAGGKPLSTGDLNTSAAPKEELVGLDDWPQSLRTTVEADHARVTALAGNRRKTADLALPAVVRGLDELLNQIADRLQADKPGLLRKPTSPAPEVPLSDLAELLGIPTDELTPPGRSEHRTALRTIKQLRTQLKDLEDHSRLTRLVTFTVRLALVLDAVPDATAALAPPALSRFAEAAPDYQWDWPFAQRLEFWQQTHHTLTNR
ncbi:hypothetical protein ACIBL3_20585 [Kribbella sp. NPDC050124]|uniref:hypothetical protein n=1 Tax=Kribbella sp. NPDC050124 TaxID=3364114 RepID=UPI00378C1C34